MEREEGQILLPPKPDQRLEVEEEIRRDARVAVEQEPPPPPPAPEDDQRKGEIQNRLLQKAKPQRQLGRHLGEDRQIRLPHLLFDVPPDSQKVRWIRALQNESEEKAQQGIPHPGGPGRKMADRRQVRPDRVQSPGIGGEVLPIHLPR